MHLNSNYKILYFRTVFLKRGLSQYLNNMSIYNCEYKTFAFFVMLHTYCIVCTTSTHVAPVFGLIKVCPGKCGPLHFQDNVPILQGYAL